MRVLMNGLAALKPKTGVGHHVAELHAALVAQFPEDTFTLYPGEFLSRVARRFNRTGSRGASAKSSPPATPAPAREKRGLGLRGRVQSSIKELAKLGSRYHFGAYSRWHGFDLYHEPNFVPYPSHLPTIVTVHDLSVVKYPQWHPADRVRYHDKHFTRGLARARHIITVSRSVRDELIELGYAPDRITAIYNGTGSQFVPQSAEAIAALRQRLDLPDDFFLCVGTIEPRKNLGTVMRAFVDLPAEIRRRCPLVLAGPWGWQAEADRRFFDEVGQPAGIRHLGYTPAEWLPQLYSAARVLLYPSHYEGFGMPLTEMLACGGAVIASTAATLREVLQGHAEYVQTEDVVGWREAMKRAVLEASWIDQLRVGGQTHAAQFTWKRAAVETFAVYQAVRTS